MNDPSPDPECVCHGNWRLILKEIEHLIGDFYECNWGERSGPGWRFFGLVHGDDDYYYGMSRNGECVLVTCVGSLAQAGFKRVSCGHMWRGDPGAVELREKCIKCNETRPR